MLKTKYKSGEDFKRDLERNFFAMVVFQNNVPILQAWREKHPEVPEDAFIFFNGGEIYGWGETLDSLKLKEEMEIYAWGGENVYKTFYEPNKPLAWELLF